MTTFETFHDALTIAREGGARGLSLRNDDIVAYVLDRMGSYNLDHLDAADVADFWLEVVREWRQADPFTNL